MEVLSSFQSRPLFNNWHTDLFGGARTDGRFINNDGATPDMGRHCLAGADGRSEIGLVGGIHVGTDVEQNINTLIHILEDLNGMNAQRIHAPPRAGDIRCSRAATERLRASLGIVPHTRLAQGLRHFLGPPTAVSYGLVKGQ